jgi:hypothetical protein
LAGGGEAAAHRQLTDPPRTLRMPWTFAHPAAVLPLRRWCPHHLSFAGLVVGSITPDLGYHLHQFDLASRAHTPVGLFVLCLPSGLLLAMLLRRFGAMLIAPLPRRHREAISPLTTRAVPRGLHAWIALAASVLIGALTHIVWDSFTHASGFVVQHSALLQQQVLPLGSRNLQAFHLLQHASTLIGVSALMLAYWRRLRRTPSPAPSAVDTWRCLLLVALLAIALAGAVPTALTAASRNGQINWSAGVVRLAIDGATLFMGLYVLAAVWLTRRRSPHTESNAP